jgi:hypothetical protein
MSQCPSQEWGKDARPRAEIPVLKWLLCLSLQRGILKASLCSSLFPGAGEGLGKPSSRGPSFCKAKPLRDHADWAVDAHLRGFST